MPFLISGNGFRCFAFRPQQLGLEEPGIRILGRFGQNVVDDGVRSRQILCRYLDARHTQQGRCEIALCRNCLIQGAARCFQLALHGKALGDGRLQVG